MGWRLLGIGLMFLLLMRGAAAQTERTYSFSIPPKPLLSALTDFTAATGIQVLQPSGTAIAGQSGAVSGSLTATQALAQLLAGTGLTYRFTDARTVALERLASGATPLGPVTVEAAAAGETATGPVQGYVASRSATGTKTDTPLLETPQSISVVTRDQVAAQGAQTITQALRYTSGVTLEPNGASSMYDEIRIRGFQPLQYLDGMQLPLIQFFATPKVEPYGLDRLEVLKGPASVLYGQNSPGGLLNLVSKRPTAEPLRELQLQLGSFERVQGAFDLRGAVSEGGQFQLRLTGLARDADTVVDFTKDRRYFIAPALTWQPSADTSVTVLAQYGRDLGSYPHQYLPTQGTLQSNPNGRLPRNRFLGEPGFDEFERDQYALGYQAEHRFDEVFSVRQAARYTSTNVAIQAIRQEGLQADLRTVNRSAFSFATDADIFTLDNQAQADFRTGPLTHNALLGVDYLRLNGSFNVGFAVAPPLDAFAPVYGQSVPALGPFTDNEQSQNQVGLYAQDQVKLDRWVLTAGVRHDWADSSTRDRLASTTQAQDDTAVTGCAGLSYVFDSGAAPYVSYASSFQPMIGLSASGTPFKPTTGRQYEVGVKYQPPGWNSLFTAAVFDITQENVSTPDPDPARAATGFTVQTGEVKAHGLELEAKASLGFGLDLTGSYTFLSSAISKSNTPGEVGNRLPLAPKHQAAMWANYSFAGGALSGLGVGGGARYVGTSFSTNDNALSLPAYALVDFAVRYELGALSPALNGAQLAVNVTNLFDTYYISAYCDTIYCSLGPGRVVLGTLTYRW